jgi:metal-responsive CopG/Arc/MetJ family transcriptional regulator
MRTHVVLRDDLVDELDKLVGKRGRSAFINDALEERLRREKLGRAMKAAAGIAKAEDYPEWETPEKVAAWVRKLRRESNKRLEKLYARVPPR